MKKNKISLFLVLILLLSTLSACAKPSEQTIKKDVDAFNQLTNDIFIDSVQSDSLTLNYSLKDPSAFGIPKITPTFGEYTLDEMKKNLVKCENYHARLKEINYKNLTADQKITYDIMKDYYKVNKDDSKLLLYYESLSPTIGIQAQLPVLLAEYHFYEKSSIDEYLTLLPDIYRYFSQIIEFEKQKSEAGLFMSDRNADDIIKQCQSLVKNKDNNFMITFFDEKIDKYEGLTKEERSSYKKTNKEIVLKKVIPAYELLIDGLTQLKGTGKNDKGLCGYPDGKKYYTQLVKTETGSNRSIADLIKLLERHMEEAAGKMRTLLQKDPSLIEKINKPNYPLTDPNEIVLHLQKAITTDFPALNDTTYTIKYVNKSLEEFLSPAFYLTPALDNYKDNTIYLNGSDKVDSSSIFTTLAHEGYPGHLYQNVYFASQNPDPIRTIMNFGGYSEGWATYVELQSYHMAGIDDNLASLLELNNAVILMIYARADIGINYEGWTRKESDDYLYKMVSITDEESLDQFYTSMIEEPANFLQYTIGYLEMLELRKKAEDKLGDNFNTKAYHEFILKAGPAPFFVLDKYLDQWIKDNN